MAKKTFAAHVVHASPRVRRMGRGREAPGDALAAYRGTVDGVRAGKPHADGMLRGVLAASVTPLREHGSEVDEDAFGPLADFFVGAGSTGCSRWERRAKGSSSRVARASPRRRSLPPGGGQPPPGRRALRRADDRGHGRARRSRRGGRRRRGRRHRAAVLQARREGAVRHFFAAAAACAPLPFYVYEFAATTGYAVASAVLERLRDDASNVVGLKVSDTPSPRFEKYLLPGFDIFVGPEALIADGMARGRVRRRLGARVCAPARGRRRRPRSDARRAPGGSASFARSSSAFRDRPRSSGCSRCRACP